MATAIPRQYSDAAPDSFSDALGGKYLGDPEFVGGIVAQYCADVQGLLYQRSDDEITAADCTSSLNALILKNAQIFSGVNPDYKIVKGYHDHSMQVHVKVALGEFYGKHKDKWNDDPVAVLFQWLMAMLNADMKVAKDDDMLLGVMMGPKIRSAVKLLSGSFAK